MRKLLKTLLTICMIFTLSACADEEGAEDPEDYETDDITQEMTTHWMDQRDEFVELAENQLDQFEERLSDLREENDEEKLRELDEQLDELHENLSEIETAEEELWEDKRDDLAGRIHELQTELDEF